MINITLDPDDQDFFLYFATSIFVITTIAYIIRGTPKPPIETAQNITTLGLCSFTITFFFVETLSMFLKAIHKFQERKEITDSLENQKPSLQKLLDENPNLTASEIVDILLEKVNAPKIRANFTVKNQ